jgi:hypothetical protein
MLCVCVCVFYYFPCSIRQGDVDTGLLLIFHDFPFLFLCVFIEFEFSSDLIILNLSLIVE